MPETTVTSVADAAPLRDALAQSAAVAQAALAVRSMTDTTVRSPPPRSGAQALSRYAMRRLGRARALPRILGPRTPPGGARKTAARGIRRHSRDAA